VAAGIRVHLPESAYLEVGARLATLTPMGEQKHIFVVGIDDFNRRTLEQVRGAREGRYVFHPLLTHDEVMVDHEIDFEALLDRARAKLDHSSVQPDAIIGYWDFPTSFLVPILARERGLRAPTVEAVARCEHKFYSRKVQHDLLGDHIPPFATVDPFAVTELPLDPPFWIKPVKSWSSQLGFKINNRDDFQSALAAIRNAIDRFACPFDQALAYAELPDDIRPITGRFCLAEGIIGGRQCTIEGYARSGEVVPYGIIDSLRHTNGSTFSRYQYPTHLDDDVRVRIHELTKKLMAGMGFDDGAFNVEYFYDEEEDQVWLLEINARISQSHAFMFSDVDGHPNHEEMVDVALGVAPPSREGRGRFACAAKLFYRTLRDDAVVSSIPSSEELRAIEEAVGGVAIEIPLREGMRLSDMADQDAYSYELARFHVGGDDEGHLLQKYQECVDRLSIGLDDAPPASLGPRSLAQLAARQSFPSIPPS